MNKEARYSQLINYFQINTRLLACFYAGMNVDANVYK